MKKLLWLLLLGGCTATGQLTPQACVTATNIYNGAVTATGTATAVLAALQTNPQIPAATIQAAQANLLKAQGVEATAKAALAAACPTTTS